MVGICGGDASPVIIPQLSPETSNIYGNDFLETSSRRRARQEDMLTDDGFVRRSIFEPFGSQGLRWEHGQREKNCQARLCRVFVRAQATHPENVKRTWLELDVRRSHVGWGFGVGGLRPEKWSRESN